MTSNQLDQQRGRPHAGSGPALSLEVWGATDQGREREGNEDYVYPHSSADTFSWQPSAEHLAQKGRLLVVADGIGGAQAGREASSTTTKVVVERYYELASPDLDRNLHVAIEEANASLYQQISSRRSLQGAGTTVTAAAIKDGMLHIANVGDSRTYLIRNGQITQLTRDHTLTQQKLDRGLIRPEQVALDPDRSVLTRSIGAGPAVQVDVFPRQQLVPGDVVLLCSDGLTDMLDDREIARIGGRGSAKRATRELIKEANRRGGFDNISVVMAKVRGPKGATRGGVLNDIRRMSSRQKAILLIGTVIVAIALCALAYLGWAMYDRGGIEPTATPVPTATVPLAATATAAPLTEATEPQPTAPQPTDTVASGAATSTPRPTLTPSTTPLPDRDGDGVIDQEDACPDTAGVAALNGCPDSDGDGVRDGEDACPQEAGLPELGGCPDRDGDGVRDIDDACPDAPGPPGFNGCPDSDGDGVPDNQDHCPDQPGPGESNGCPSSGGGGGGGGGGDGGDGGGGGDGGDGGEPEPTEPPQKEDPTPEG